MKRKLVISLLATASAIACAFGLAACGEKPHEHDYSSQVVAPTCTEGGYTVHTCACGDSYTDEQTQPTGHAWGEWQTVKAADCTNSGSQKRVCANDSTHVETQDTDPLGHSYGAPVWTWNGYESATAKLTCATDNTHVETVSAVITNEITTPATCTTGGVKTYTATVTVNGNTYTDTKTETVAATGHSYSDEWTSDAQYHWHAATCGHSNELNGKAEHTWDNGYCSICGKKDPSMPSEGLTYTLSNDETYYSVEGIGTCTDTELVIPSTYNDKPIKRIGGFAFENCSSLTSVVIPDIVTSIGPSAFYNCSNLKSVYYSGDIASWCNISGLNNIMSIKVTLFINGNRVEGEIIIPDGVTSISDYAFYNCSGLTSVTIPNSVTSIGSYAFYNCSGLTSVTIPNSVTSIGSHAFENCSNLTSITIPNSVTSIGNRAFNNTAYYKNNNNWNNNVLYIGKHLIAASSVSGEYAVNYGTLTIANDAFYGNNNLTSITIPDSVTSIGSSAFKYCSSLTNVIIGNGVTSIGSNAFENCSSLKSVTIGNGVTSIGNRAFSGCKSLTEINYNATECEDLISDNYVFSSAGENVTGITVTIGANVRKIPACLFCPFYYSGYAPKITSVVFEEGCICESIGDYAFRYCDSLTSITIGNSVTSIGSSAFNGCSSLTSVTIPDSVISIGSDAFEGCSSLTEINYNATECEDLRNSVFYKAGQSGTGITVTIGANVKKIPAYLFYVNNSIYADKITSVVFEEGSVCKNIGEYAFARCSGLTSITIPDSVTSIGEYAFRSCSNLTSITIPDSVTSIGSNAFYGCNNLTNITIGNGVTSIGYSAFYDTAYYNDSNNWDNDVLYIGKYLIDANTSISGEYIIKDGTLTIADSAFSWCRSLTNVIIGNGVTSIGSNAFYNCSSLTSVTIPDSVTSIGSSAFNGCSSLTSVTIPDSVISIGSDAFYGCSDLTSITLPFVGATKDGTDNTHFGYIFGANNYEHNSSYVYSSLKTVVITGGTSIDNYAFYGCNNLTSITIPDRVTSIGYGAFYGCSNLTSITIPNSVTSIGVSAFYNTAYYNDSNNWDNDVLYIGKYLIDANTSISGEYTVKDGTLTIANYAFYNCDSLTSITIPDSVTSIGSDAFNGCSSLMSITLPFVGATKDSTDNTHFGYIFGADNYEHNSSCVPSSLKTVVITGGTSIDNYAFYGCNNLTSITIPDSVTSIGYRAFEGCSSLTSVTIPDSVTSIGESAFYYCNNLTSITFNGTITEWQAISKGSGWNSSTGNFTITCTDGTLDKDGNVVS